MNRPLYAGLDIGGSFLKYGYGNPVDGILMHDKLPVDDRSLDGLYRLLRTAVQKINDHAGQPVSAVALGSPGTIDSNRGIVLGYSPNLPEWRGAQPTAMLSDTFGIPAYIENDANLMAFGEASHYNFDKTVLGITIGTGIGSGLVINDQIYRGENFMSMELGHTVVMPDGRLCKCGKKGCVEAYSSATGLIEQSIEALSDVHDDTVNHGYTMTVKQALEMATVNESIHYIVKKSVSYLGQAVANAITLLDCDIVLIGGGVADIEAYPFDALRQEILKFLLPEIQEHVLIAKARYGNQAALRGSLFLCDRNRQSS